MSHPYSAPYGMHAGMPTVDALEALSDAMRSEKRQLDELLAIMRRQRDAVAADDLQGLDDSVFATHRVLRTLAEARRRRRQATRLLGEPEDLGIHELDGALGERMSPVMRLTRDELQISAHALAREVETNKKVLKDAMAAGERYVRALAAPGSSTEGPLTYGGGAAPAAPERRGEGLLVNRTA